MGGFMAPNTYVAENYHQCKRWHLVMWRLDAPEKADTRVIRWEWLDGEGATGGAAPGWESRKGDNPSNGNN